MHVLPLLDLLVPGQFDPLLGGGDAVVENVLPLALLVDLGPVFGTTVSLFSCKQEIDFAHLFGQQTLGEIPVALDPYIPNSSRLFSALRS